MSISASLSNALSGLTAASRAAEIVSSNVSNAMTEGYARRELELSPRFTGGMGSGVQIDGVRRIVDEITLRERRLAEADVGYSRTNVEFYEDLARLLGKPDDAGSLTEYEANLETSLLEAVSRPDSEPRLSAVLFDAQAFASKLNAASDGIQALREDADREIGREVERLNLALTHIGELNSEILRLRSTDSVAADLLDQRQMLVDDISELIPIRQLQRDNGTVALYTMGGALLLDAKAAVFDFQQTATITADMTIQSSALSGLVLNGNSIDTLAANSPIAGGRLAALFDARDKASVASQANLDEVARDLIARFEAPGPDPTLAVGDPGLFTDGGTPLNTANLEGLASRIAVNDLVDPAAGGTLWRLRDGLGAAGQGPMGDGSILAAYAAIVTEARVPVGGTLGTAARSLAGFTSSMASFAGQALSAGATQLSFHRAMFEGLRHEELSNGVDTDQEMQKLLLIEQAYAANARVIQTVDELIQTLIGL